MAGTITVIRQGSGSGATSSTEAINPENILEAVGLDIDTTSLADAQIASGQLNIFADEAASKLKIKYNNGTAILNGEVALS